MPALIEACGAISVHHTATSDASWDGPTNKTRLPNTAAALKAANAWVDEEDDAKAKSAYKFIHHEVAEDGTVGSANIRACTNGIGILNGGRGGTNIPDSDRQGVYNHLAAHIKDAGGEAPELKSTAQVWAERGLAAEYERRTFDFRMVMPDHPDPDDMPKMPKLEGYAAVFNERVEIFRGMYEEIAPGSFKKTIKEGDIKAFWNHNPDIILGRSKNDTLRLAEDSKGLKVSIDPPETGLVREMCVEPIKRGDVSQMSFGFRSIREQWTDLEDGSVLRTVLEAQLFEVSPVCMPAYPTTSISARAAQQYAEYRTSHQRPVQHPEASRSVLIVTAPALGHAADRMRMQTALAARDL